MNGSDKVISFWIWLTGLGEAHIVLPLALALLLVLVFLDARRSARLWVPAMGAAVLLTTASKIMFMGWGLGIAWLDFTGFSGHAMQSAAVYPVLGHVFARRRPGSTAWWGAAAGYMLAALIAVSRVVVGAHSVSESVTGFVLGGLASACAMGLVMGAGQRIPRWAWLSALAWMMAVPLVIRSSGAHEAVTRVALTLSHRTTPFQRADLHRPVAASVKPLHRQKMVFFSH